VSSFDINVNLPLGPHLVMVSLWSPYPFLEPTSTKSNEESMEPLMGV